MIPEFPIPLKVKKLRLLITQTGTATPTKIELENTLGTITLQRYDIGSYGIHTNGLLTLNKTYMNAIALGTDNVNDTDIFLHANAGRLRLRIADENDIYLDTYDNTDTPTEWHNILGTLCIPTIYVYK